MLSFQFGMPNWEWRGVVILETLFFVIFGIVYFLVWVFTADNRSSTENEQLDKLDDGMGNIIADGEHMTRQEAEDAHARGELYDTYY